MTKVSILSAVHNEARYIQEMIDSVRAQTLGDWELLFVDDHSSDDTVSRIEEAASQDGRIRLVAAGHKIGKVAAFNAAHAASSGEYVVLLAGDDKLPMDSLERRVAVFSQARSDQAVVAFFKLRTFSQKPKFDGLVLPRGARANTSGGTIAMNRDVAKRVFPIPEGLSGEDIWLRYAATGAADVILESLDVVLEYRIHAGNSNPRDRPFKEMSSIIHKKHQAYQALLQAEGTRLKEGDREHLAELHMLEQLRFDGKPLSVLLHRGNLPLSDRLSFVAMAHPALWALRRRLDRALAGRRAG